MWRVFEIEEDEDKVIESEVVVIIIVDGIIIEVMNDSVKDIVGEKIVVEMKKECEEFIVVRKVRLKKKY